MCEPKDATKIIDGHQWMRALRIPMWALLDIRKLRVGESYLIGHFDGPSGLPNQVGTASAEITREPGKGIYSFGAIWLISFGRRQHTHIFATGRFVLRPGREILFEPQDLLHERGFRQVCRQIMLVITIRQAFGVEDSHRIFETGPHRYDTLWACKVIGKDGFTAAGIPGPDAGGPTVVITPPAASG